MKETSPKQLVFLLPSRTLSTARLKLAEKSLKSLSDNFGDSLDLLVVHDGIKKPWWLPTFLSKLLPATKKDMQGVRLYESRGATVFRRSGRGSASALLLAVDKAIEQGFELGYIHLDDHIYHPELSALMIHATKEFTLSPRLAWLRFSGYPIISPGGREFKRLENRIVFDEIELQPQPRDNYTCWSTLINESNAVGRYWPIAMWHSVYRLSILKTMLTKAIQTENCLHLANVEEFFKSDRGMRWLANELRGMGFGYINMQFTGFEMHRNPHYQLLLAGANDPLL